jgi:uncharacterized protein
VRVVIDTNVLVSALIRRQGVNGQILQVLRDGRLTLIYSTQMVIEIIDVLSRPHIRTKYGIQSEDITALIHLIRLRGELVLPKRKVTICRDPKDNVFLKAAIAGRAEAIISGENYLLALVEYESIPIVRPNEFLAKE